MTCPAHVQCNREPCAYGDSCHGRQRRRDPSRASDTHRVSVCSRWHLRPTASRRRPVVRHEGAHRRHAWRCRCGWHWTRRAFPQARRTLVSDGGAWGIVCLFNASGAIFPWFRRWQVERGLTRLKKIADSLPAGPERSRLERDIHGIQKANTARLVRAMRNISGHEQSATVRTRRRSH